MEAFVQNKESLLLAVECSFGHKVSTTKDFTLLSSDISHRLDKKVGVSTLKRIWGYVNEEVTPREATLDILAEYIGCRNWQNFCEIQDFSVNSDSNFVSNKALYTKDLAKGTVIRLTWSPERICVVMLRQDNTYQVLRSIKTRLVPGTTFTCQSFVAGETAILNNVCMGGIGEPCVYQIGRSNGIQFDVLNG